MEPTSAQLASPSFHAPMLRASAAFRYVLQGEQLRAADAVGARPKPEAHG
jgi:hypothetical protein